MIAPEVLDRAAIARLRDQLVGNVVALRLLAHIETLHGDLARLEGRLTHVSANHADMVSRCALLSQRPDLPADRLPAYRELERLQAENTAMRLEEVDSDRLRERMSELLRGVAAGLKGPPPPLTLHDWSDLPQVAQRVGALYEAVGALIKAKGRFHTEQNYAALVAAFDAIERVK
jgi:hypothetical protein